MRVERNASSPISARPARVAKTKASAPSEGGDAPTESWERASVEEREASLAPQEEFRPPNLPGIAQGLTADYLRPRRSLAPTTLLANTLPPSEFALNLFPEISTDPDPGRRYAQNLAQQTKAFYRKYFSDEFLDLDLLIEFQKTDKNNAGYEWIQGRSRLTLQSSTPIEFDTPHLQKTSGSLGSRVSYRRGVADLISFVHEYAHATYDALLGVPADIDVLRANRAFSEGFAVLLELRAIDHLLELPDSRLVRGDKSDLSERRAQRITWLQQVLEGPVPASQMAYAEGIELMAALHRAGGLPEVVEFVRSVVPNKANALSRSHPDYRRAVGNPRLMKDLVLKR